ncbi:hypothetical protein BDR26DRAFT_850054 [Obelidium mucronatum]|nr:hypothetical protein BDR26DRAFT_850054 [Obelidium mucronatum]
MAAISTLLPPDSLLKTAEQSMEGVSNFACALPKRPSAPFNHDPSLAQTMLYFWKIQRELEISEKESGEERQAFGKHHCSPWSTLGFPPRNNASYSPNNNPVSSKSLALDTLPSASGVSGLRHQYPSTSAHEYYLHPQPLQHGNPTFSIARLEACAADTVRAWKTDCPKETETEYSHPILHSFNSNMTFCVDDEDENEIDREGSTVAILEDCLEVVLTHDDGDREQWDFTGQGQSATANSSQSTGRLSSSNSKKNDCSSASFCCTASLPALIHESDHDYDDITNSSDMSLNFEEFDNDKNGIETRRHSEADFGGYLQDILKAGNSVKVSAGSTNNMVAEKDNQDFMLMFKGANNSGTHNWPLSKRRLLGNLGKDGESQGYNFENGSLMNDRRAEDMGEGCSQAWTSGDAYIFSPAPKASVKSIVDLLNRF